MFSVSPWLKKWKRSESKSSATAPLVLLIEKPYNKAMLTIPGKIPITIHPLFWALIFLLGWINSEVLNLTLIWACVIFVSVLVHEYGHALTAVFFGQTAKIDLVALGGLTSRSGKHLTLWQDFLIVLNGPLAGLLLFFCFDYLLGHNPSNNPYVRYAFAVGRIVNLWWTILNLIPIQPMDGGRLLSIILESMLGLKGVKIALFISMVLAGLVAGWAFLTGNVLLGAVILMFLFESYRNWQSTLLLTEVDKDKGMQDLYAEAERETAFGNNEAAEAKLTQILNDTKRGYLYTGAAQLLAGVYAKQGKDQEAIELLQSVEGKLLPDQLMVLQGLYYKTGDYRKAAEAGTAVFKKAPSGDVAVANALTFAKLGELKPTIGWLQAALREGKGLKQVLKRKEFDSFRNDPQFEELGRQV